MDALIKLIAEKTGITSDQAKEAVITIEKYMQDRTPPVLHSSISQVLAGEKFEDTVRNKADELGKEIRKRSDDLASDLKSAIDKWFGKSR